MKTVTKVYENGTLTKLHYEWTPGWSVLMFIAGLLIGKHI